MRMTAREQDNRQRIRALQHFLRTKTWESTLEGIACQLAVWYA